VGIQTHLTVTLYLLWVFHGECGIEYPESETDEFMDFMHYKLAHTYPRTH